MENQLENLIKILNSFIWICCLNSICYRKNYLKITKNIAQEYEIDNLCMAGGVALVVLQMEKYLGAEISKTYGYSLQAGDAGGAIGAALAFWFKEKKFKKNNLNDSMNGSYLGPSYSDEKEKS